LSNILAFKSSSRCTFLGAIANCYFQDGLHLMRDTRVMVRALWEPRVHAGRRTGWMDIARDGESARIGAL